MDVPSTPPDAVVSVVSALPGRTRLSVPRHRRTAAELERIAHALEDRDAVHGVSTSQRTGSVLIHHERDVHPEAAFGPALGELGLTLSDAGTAPTPSAPGPAARLRRTAGALNSRTASATGGVDLRLLVPAGLAVLSLRQLVRGAPGLRHAPWYQLAWYSWDSFVKLHAPPAAPPAGDA